MVKNSKLVTKRTTLFFPIVIVPCIGVSRIRSMIPFENFIATSVSTREKERCRKNPRKNLFYLYSSTISVHYLWISTRAIAHSFGSIHVDESGSRRRYIAPWRSSPSN